MESEGKIIIKGARVNNLKNIDLEIPRGKLVVITGLSGSGKSSLAFDTLYAEGQRRYVESLSSYARQFLGRMSKPETDSIKGIPPAIAIEQKVNIRNTRSTVGTSTEIYDYIRMLFARIGKTISPVSGKEVHKDSVSDVADAVLEYPEGTRIALLTKIPERDGRSLKEQLEVLIKEGFTRIETDGEIILISEFLKKSAEDRNRPGREILLLVDRLAVSSEHETTARISDSVETAFFEGNGYAVLKIYTETDTVIREFSRKFEADGMEFEEPSDVMFNFNSPGGACPVCGGSGRYTGIDENLVVPNQSLSLFEDAVTCWKGDLAGEWKQEFIRKSEKHRFPIHRPYYKLTEAEKDLLWNGKNSLKGINDFFIMVEANVHKIQYRVIQARYRGKTLCPACSGTRLKPGANYVKVAGRTIPEIVNTPLSELQKIFYFENRGENNPCPYLNDSDYITARRLLTEINSRLKLVTDVGLGYLTLNRQSSTLSGGESQRINLATSIGSSLTGSLYILDEPSIGLHARDTKRMIKVLRQLQEMGNTVIVVEHDEEIIRSADLLIDIGPGAGQKGGKVVYYGSVPKKGDRPAVQAGIAHTIDYLSGAEQIPVPAKRRRWNNYIEIRGARENNLKEINVRFPLNVITAVTGVSGSGKSSLVKEVLYQTVKRHCDNLKDNTVRSAGEGGDMHLIKAVEAVDQNPAGKSSRSNPVTYIKAWEEIRNLYADQPEAKQYKYTPAHFSFNMDGGRCEECKGEGYITVEMQFMADVRLECEACKGKRFGQEILDVEFLNKNIADVLDMTVDEAAEFFKDYKKITEKLRSLQSVGLGYVKLGQPSSSMSGGENQRLKLALHLGEERTEHTIFILDEPTTGLHFHDVKTLLNVFNALVSRGHTVVVIEHNIDVIKSADYVIDLGPEGGSGGGNVVCAGTPEEVAECSASYTGQMLGRDAMHPGRDAMNPGRDAMNPGRDAMNRVSTKIKNKEIIINN